MHGFGGVVGWHNRDFCAKQRCGQWPLLTPITTSFYPGEASGEEDGLGNGSDGDEDGDGELTEVGKRTLCFFLSFFVLMGNDYLFKRYVWTYWYLE